MSYGVRNERSVREPRSRSTYARLRKIMKCLCSGEQLRVDEMIPSSESLATKDYSASIHSSLVGEPEQKPDTGNIEEAESSLRESGSLNYEEARALLGRYEYQKGNIEAALHVFEGIDISAVTPKVKVTLAQRAQPHRRRSQNYASTPLSIHAASLLLEAIFLKAKSLQALGRYKEAAQSCTIVLDIVESSLPTGLPENLGADCKLQETLNKAAELLPELWKLASSPRETIASYRRALLHQWNLDTPTIANIQKEFAIFLLYSGGESNPPNLRSQMGSAFVPGNNIEEAILLLIILLRKVSLKRIEWDPEILDHLSYALAISGGLRALANQVEELLPQTIDQSEMYQILALCYYGEGEDQTALNLLRKLLRSTEHPTSDPVLLLLASKICSATPEYAGEGVNLAQRAIANMQGKCDELFGVGNFVLGLSLSAHSKSSAPDSDRVRRQTEALQSLETAGRMTRMNNSNIIYHLCVENAEQRKLDAALYYAKCFLKLEGGSTVKGWVLLAQILSAQKQFLDAETVTNAALEQTGKWDQGELLRSKAKLQIAQGQVGNAIDTYSQLLAVLQVQSKSFGAMAKLKDGQNRCRTLELEIWLDLASIYIKLSQWQDAEICLSKAKTINHYSASRFYTVGLLHQSKGQHKEALREYNNALTVDPNHVPSLVSTAVVLRRSGGRSPQVVRSFLMEALRLDKMSASAWYNLGLLYKETGVGSALEAAECFEAALVLEETAPVESLQMTHQSCI
ncbi:protein NPGR2 [Ipomoea triloba]|uniref:protein NPGR2 n=1 Tax=Ipomoea triloba TaxID=35885 RepID=UPI00125DA44A|nr:protein NPGR2 [Ipomoea triloba]